VYARPGSNRLNGGENATVTSNCYVILTYGLAVETYTDTSQHEHVFLAEHA